MTYKKLNECIVLAPQDPVVSLTKYCEVHEIGDDLFFLLHLLTGAIDVISKEIASVIMPCLEVGGIPLLDKEVINFLVSRGYFADKDAEQKFIDELAEKHQESLLQKPVEFFICTTFTCPIGCSYCFEGDLTTRPGAKAITRDQVDSAFSSMETILKETGKPMREIVLFGGEPLLPKTKKSVEYVFEKAAVVGHPVSVCTSGVFVTDFMPVFRWYKESIKVVRITLDGPQSYHDSLRSFPRAFERATQGVQDLLDADIPVMIRINVGKANFESLPELARFFESKGWVHHGRFDAVVTGIKDRTCVGDKAQMFREDELALKFLEMRKEFPETLYLRPLNIFMSLRHLATNLRHLDGMVKIREEVIPLQTIKFHGCGASDGTLYVFGADSKVYSCTEGIGNPIMGVGDYHPELNLRPELLQKWHGWHKYQITKCRECKYLLVCGGTCLLTSVKLFGSGSEPICPPIPSIMNGYVKNLGREIEII